MAPGPGRRCRETWRTACLRDAVALQLARRGFDGLRGTALWLVAELAADFTRALGYQLAQVAVPSPYRDASLLAAAPRPPATETHAEKGPPPPRAVQELYSTARAVMHYKQSGDAL